jgi:3-phosphoshikimate 1-carboxyvinyltransferase
VIVDVLKSVGAGVTIDDYSVVVRKGSLNAFEFDATDCPDLFPPLVCLAAVCDGASVIKGVSRLRHKESDRAVVLQEEFEKIGVNIELSDDYMKIIGSKIRGGTIDSRGDHRIAMAAGVMNLVSETEISISGKEAVNKSYPGFFSDLQVLSERQITF